MGVESTGRLLRRVLSAHKHTLLWPLLLFSLFFVFLNSKMRYIVEDPNYKRLWHSATVPPRSLSAVGIESSPADIITDPSYDLSAHCKPKSNAVFLKTHKCAGSTVQNVFMRYGNTHNLTFALPRKGNYMGHPARFDYAFVPDPVRFNVTYNLLVHHNRFGHEATSKLMPKDSLYFTVLRDPVDLFESMYSYYGLFSFFKMPLERLGQLPAQSTLLKRRSSGKFGINQMLFDLGFPSSQFKNASAVSTYIAFLDRTFDLVMISDRMDESLVLLRDLMCWDIDDIVVFKLNARNSRFKTKLSSPARERLRKLNSADQQLYDHFMDKLNKQVESFGKDKMASELKRLQNRTDFWYRSCVQKQDLLKRLKTPHQREANPRVMAYMPTNTTNGNCWALTIPELEFTDHLRSKQKFYQKEAEEIAREEDHKKVKSLKTVNRPLQARSHFRSGVILPKGALFGVR